MINTSSIFDDTVDYEKAVKMFRDDFASNGGLYYPKNADVHMTQRNAIFMLGDSIDALKRCIAILEDARDFLTKEYRS